jgi:hypothetical protein
LFIPEKESRQQGVKAGEKLAAQLAALPLTAFKLTGFR